MSKNKGTEDEVIVDVQEVYSKTETFIEENKNILTIVVAAIAVVIGGYFAYNSFYLAPLQEEAVQEMFMAEKYFAQDSMNLAIYGDDVYPGFIEIADNYSGTKAGNLANYYLGIAYLKTGQYEAAIASLDDFDADDDVVSTVAISAKGDAYMELGDINKAASLYAKASERRTNEFTTPLMMMKAAQTYELLGDYNKALDYYKAIQEDYSSSPQASEVDKLISRAESFVK